MGIQLQTVVIGYLKMGTQVIEFKNGIVKLQQIKAASQTFHAKRLLFSLYNIKNWLNCIQ